MPWCGKYLRGGSPDEILGSLFLDCRSGRRDGRGCPIGSGTGPERRDVVRITAMVLQANPCEFPEAHFLNSLAHLSLNDYLQAEKRAREAIGMGVDEKYPQVEHILGLALANQHHFEEASAHLRKYLEIAPDAVNASQAREDLAQVERNRARQLAPHVFGRGVALRSGQAPPLRCLRDAG